MIVSYCHAQEIPRCQSGPLLRRHAGRPPAARPARSRRYTSTPPAVIPAGSHGCHTGPLPAVIPAGSRGCHTGPLPAVIPAHSRGCHTGPLPAVIPARSPRRHTGTLPLRPRLATCRGRHSCASLPSANGEQGTVRQVGSRAWPCSWMQNLPPRFRQEGPVLHVLGRGGMNPAKQTIASA